MAVQVVQVLQAAQQARRKMSNLKRLFILIIIGVMLMSLVGCNRIDVDLEEYKLVFEDNFDGSDLDPAKWVRCPEQPRQVSQGGKGWWRDECVEVKDGNLCLTQKLVDGELKSGAVRTYGLFENTYGYYEMKFKVDKTQGLWYAFWLMCDGVSKVGNAGRDGTEIDIFEIIPYLGEWQTNFHWDGYGEHHQIGKGKPHNIKDSFYDEWHVVKFLWTEDSYTVELDGEVTFHCDNRDRDEYGGICQVPTFMKISAEFGSWGGDVVEELLPATMLVDYVRVYQK